MSHPVRGDEVEAWIKRHRDDQPPGSAEWFALEYLLDDYRLRADCGTGLDEDLAAEKCPKCGQRIILLWLGVKCSQCPWWFCY